MGEPRVGRQSGSRLVEFAPTQRAKKITSEDDALTLPSSQIQFDEMVDAAVHRVADVRAEGAAAQCGVLGEKLGQRPVRSRQDGIKSETNSHRGPPARP